MSCFQALRLSLLYLGSLSSDSTEVLLYVLWNVSFFALWYLSTHQCASNCFQSSRNTFIFLLFHSLTLSYGRHHCLGFILLKMSNFYTLSEEWKANEFAAVLSSQNSWHFWNKWTGKWRNISLQLLIYFKNQL